jgi:transposase-like protein
MERSQVYGGWLEGQDPITALAHEGAVRILREALEKEINTALGIERKYSRGEARLGYRNGSKGRRLWVPTGVVEDFRVPRGQYFTGAEREFQSKVIDRYQRRAKRINELVVEFYVGGLSGRRFNRALRPLFRGTGLSRSTVSRICQELLASFRAWRERDLSEWKVGYVFLDGFSLPVRHLRVERQSLLVAHGVLEDGSRVVLDMMLGGRESTESWKSLLRGMSRRGLRTPVLAIIDGNPGLIAAVTELWPEAEVQRCYVHKKRNVLARVPKSLQEEVAADIDVIYHASDYTQAMSLRQKFERKWGKALRAAVEVLKEDWQETTRFLSYPMSQHKALRSTNIIERLFEEFRRRTKTIPSFPTAESAVQLLFGLFASGQIAYRRIDGADDIAKAVKGYEERREDQKSAAA